MLLYDEEGCVVQGRRQGGDHDVCGDHKEVLINIVETMDKKPADGEDLHDDITGVRLGPQKVALGKLKELQKLEEREVYPCVDR